MDNAIRGEVDYHCDKCDREFVIDYRWDFADMEIKDTWKCKCGYRADRMPSVPMVIGETCSKHS